MEIEQGSYRLDSHTGIDVSGGLRAKEIASFLRQHVAQQTGIDLSQSHRARGIALTIDPKIRGAEAYRLSVTSRGIVIQASTDKGLFWGVQTLRQLIPEEHAPSVSIPAVRIEDAPAFAYRGFMLDVGRHFYPVSFIKKQLDLLSYYKVNVFHWHLTEDQGWRIQIKRYPKLTEMGAWRTEADGQRYGGFCTQRDIRAVVQYAQQRNIRVIPEIEMPGHSVAALASYPQLSCARKPLAVPTTWGVFKDIDCVGKPGTFVFLKHVLDEVMALFPSPDIHIGGDETPKDRWKTCASCQALMHAQGLKDEEGLQSYFIQRIQRYLASKGRTLVGWDEILEGGADKHAIVEIWRGDDEARKALLNGNRIIVAGPFYLDAPLDVLTVEKIYSTDITGRTSPSALPDDEKIFREHRAQILGGEAPLWSEHANPFNAESKMYPRLLALAENLWTGKHDPAGFADFERRLQAQYRWLDENKVAYGPEDKPVVAYSVAFDAGDHAWQLHAKRGFGDVVTHFTMSDVSPNNLSPSFTDMRSITRAGTLKVVPYRMGLRYDNATRFVLINNLAAGHPVTFLQPPSAAYAPGGVLTDGVLGGADFHDGRWAAWHDNNLDATIDLGKRIAFRTIRIGFMRAPPSGVFLPGRIVFFISADGTHWTQVYAYAPVTDVSSPPGVQRFSFHSPSSLTARFIRIEAQQPDHRLLSAYAGEKVDTWLFVDEILVQ